MKMKIDIPRLSSLLARHNFKLGHISEIEDSCEFIRPSSVQTLFEILIIRSAGKRNEVVCATICISTARRAMYKGLGRTSLLFEVASNKERGWTVIETAENSLVWEMKLAAIASERVAALAREVGPELLTRTESTRAAVKEYMKRLNLSQPVSRKIARLREQADASIYPEAVRLAEWPGVLHEIGLEDVYLLAALTILVYEREVEDGNVSFFGEDPLVNTALMWRLKIMADSNAVDLTHNPAPIQRLRWLAR